MTERELIEPHPGDKRYQRRKEDGTFGESDETVRFRGETTASAIPCNNP